MIGLLKKIRIDLDQKLQSDDDLFNSTSYHLKRYVDRTIFQLEWEDSSFQERQIKRKRLLAIIEDNHQGISAEYEKAVIELYDVMLTLLELLGNNFDECGNFIALVMIEMRSIDKDYRMKSINHIDKDLFMKCLENSSNSILTSMRKENFKKAIRKLHELIPSE